MTSDRNYVSRDTAQRIESGLAEIDRYVANQPPELSDNQLARNREIYPVGAILCTAPAGGVPPFDGTKTGTAACPFIKLNSSPSPALDLSATSGSAQLVQNYHDREIAEGTTFLAIPDTAGFYYAVANPPGGCCQCPTETGDSICTDGNPSALHDMFDTVDPLWSESGFGTFSVAGGKGQLLAQANAPGKTITYIAVSPGDGATPSGDFETITAGLTVDMVPNDTDQGFQAELVIEYDPTITGLAKPRAAVRGLAGVKTWRFGSGVEVDSGTAWIAGHRLQIILSKNGTATGEYQSWNVSYQINGLQLHSEVITGTPDNPIFDTPQGFCNSRLIITSSRNPNLQAQFDDAWLYFDNRTGAAPQDGDLFEWDATNNCYKVTAPRWETETALNTQTINGGLAFLSGQGPANPTLGTSYNIASATRVSIGRYRCKLIQDTFFGALVLDNAIASLAFGIAASITSELFQVNFDPAGGAADEFDIVVVEAFLGAGNKLEVQPYDIVPGDFVSINIQAYAGTGALPPVATIPV